jgi:hypothetical protein
MPKSKVTHDGAGTHIGQAGQTVIGFAGATPVSMPVNVVGAKGGNAALTALVTALAQIGLITDSTS